MTKTLKPKDPTAKQISEVMRALGKRTSKKKAASSKANGKLGGRPKQEPTERFDLNTQ